MTPTIPGDFPQHRPADRPAAAGPAPPPQPLHARPHRHLLSPRPGPRRLCGRAAQDPGRGGPHQRQPAGLRRVGPEILTCGPICPSQAPSEPTNARAGPRRNLHESSGRNLQPGCRPAEAPGPRRATGPNSGGSYPGCIKAAGRAAGPPTARPSGDPHRPAPGVVDLTASADRARRGGAA